jgi:hypothetical protein
MIRNKGRPEVISLGRVYASAERKGVTSCFGSAWRTLSICKGGDQSLICFVRDAIVGSTIVERCCQRCWLRSRCFQLFYVGSESSGNFGVERYVVDISKWLLLRVCVVKSWNERWALIVEGMPISRRYDRQGWGVQWRELSDNKTGSGITGKRTRVSFDSKHCSGENPRPWGARGEKTSGCVQGGRCVCRVWGERGTIVLLASQRMQSHLISCYAPCRHCSRYTIPPSQPHLHGVDKVSRFTLHPDDPVPYPGNLTHLGLPMNFLLTCSSFLLFFFCVLRV